MSCTNVAQMSDIAVVVGELREEWGTTDRMIAKLSSAQWNLETPSPGWRIKDQIAHLATSDAAALAAAKFAGLATPPSPAEVTGKALDPSVLGDQSARLTARMPQPVVVGLWRATRRKLAETLIELPSDRRIPWFGRSLTASAMASARIMETWAHTVDISDALGLGIDATDRLRHTAYMAVENRDGSFRAHDQDPPDEEVRLELTLPSGVEWIAGPAHTSSRVLGSALDFCLVAARRRHRDDTDLQAVGLAADRWLQVVQAYAGAAGSGRQPRALESKADIFMTDNERRADEQQQ